MMTGFIDVGGGTRGIFGAGVTDFCIENGIECDLFIGVSAGAANGVSFIAKQNKRNYKFYNEYGFRKEYMSFDNLLKTGSFIDLDYVYSTLSDTDGEYPVNFSAFKESHTDFYAVATDGLTGEPVYFGKNTIEENNLRSIAASCCVPVIDKPYMIDGHPYFDGGISDPIPYKWAQLQGCDKLVVILTKPKNFVRTSKKDRVMADILKIKHPGAAKAMATRSMVYNKSLDELKELERNGKACIIAPDTIEDMKTLTLDHDKLNHLYLMGHSKGREIANYLYM